MPAVNGVTALPELAAMYRRKRLVKGGNNWMVGMLIDLAFGALPWVLFAAILAASVTAIRNEVDGAADTFALFNAPVALAAISTFASFLLVAKQSANLGNNSAIIGGFGDLSGSVINIALYVKSQISSGKTIEFITLADGSGGFFQTTRIALALSSVCFIVKYNGRNTKILPVQLPLGQDPKLLEAYSRLLAPANGSKGVDEFAAIILTIGELVDEFQQNQKAAEYSVLFSQITATTGAQGRISGTAGYGGPYAFGARTHLRSDSTNSKLLTPNVKSDRTDLCCCTPQVYYEVAALRAVRTISLLAHRHR